MPPRKKRVERKIVNVFSTRNEGGNPCAVIDMNHERELNAIKMQSIATKYNLSETVFIRNDFDKAHNTYKIRFFATKREIPFCIHGSLGAAYFLHKTYGFNHLTLLPELNTELSMDVAYSNQSLITKLTNTSEEESRHSKTIDHRVICCLLNISEEDIHETLPCEMESVGSLKLFVPIKTRKRLFSIKPDLDFTAKWCELHSVNGIYAYSTDTEDVESHFVGRNFNPLFSHQEDIATGSAAAALCKMLYKNNDLETNYTIEQGGNLGHLSKIYVSINRDRIEIKGNAYFKQ